MGVLAMSIYVSLTVLKVQIPVVQIKGIITLHFNCNASLFLFIFLSH